MGLKPPRQRSVPRNEPLLAACLAKGVGECGQPLQEAHSPQQIRGVRHAGVHGQQLLELRGFSCPSPGVINEKLDVAKAGANHG